MLRTIVTKLLHLIPVLLIVSAATFFMMDLVAGRPEVAILGANATEDQYAQVREKLGLDEPAPARFVGWLSDALRGDLGRSYVPPVQEVDDMIKSRFPVTLQLTIMALGIALLLAVPLALVSAYRAERRLDRVASGVAFAVISIPSFLAALLLIYVFVFHKHWAQWGVGIAGTALAVWLALRTIRRHREDAGEPQRWRGTLIRIGVILVVMAGTILLYRAFPQFPRQGFPRWTSEKGKFSNLRHAFLPALTLGLIEAGVFMRLLRADVIATLQEDFILSAKAKGMPISRILVRDALRPSSFSLLTVAGVTLGRLIGGTVIVETIFNVPGMGTMLVNAIGNKDLFVVQGGVLVIAIFYVFVNALVDISYAYIDPRIRRGRA